jgi:enoyl-CoA hydratase/carnithine racemase
MSFSDIRVATDAQVATITLNRPQALNAITLTMLSEAKQAVDQAGADPGVRAIVITGEGRAFSAGVDLKALNDIKLEAGAVGGVLDNPARALIHAIRTVPKPVIAKINGFCFTGALELALACDLILVAEEAKLGDTHAKWGLRPTWGMSARLPAAIGLARAKELSFTARTIKGAEAAAIGIANRAVPLAELDAAVDALLAEILPNSADSIAAYKTLYNEGAAAAANDAARFEESSQFDIADTADRLADFMK